MGLAEELLWIWAPHFVVELNLCLYHVMAYIAIVHNFDLKCLDCLHHWRQTSHQNLKLNLSDDAVEVVAGQTEGSVCPL